MGVQGLWSLLEPVGRRINIEALSNKKVAVDASIWLVQFIKAMRDDKGEMLRNAHLVGFFRRICRLLFHRIRPVFVFDGATPALKRRTTIARRRRREQQTAKLRKTAEKMLMAQLRKHALTQASKHGAEEVAPGLGAKETLEAVRAAMQQDTSGPDPLRPGGPDEDLAAFGSDLGDIHEEPAAQADEPSSNQPALEPAAGQPESAPPRKRQRLVKAGARARQEAPAAMPRPEDLDEDANIAAIMGAEMDAEYENDPQAELMEMSDGAAYEAEGGSEEEEEEEESDDEGEELMLPEGSTELDPEVLGTLPPSMQLEFMDKMRERMVSENREQFQARTGTPIDFSSFQMQQYLKASAFRRQMDKIKDAMNAKARAGEAGVQSRRIAAQSGREYILQQDAPAAPSAAPTTSSNPAGVLEISLDLPPGERDLGSLLASDEREAEVDEEEEDVEWETADGDEAGSQPSSRPSSAAKPLHWRERAAQRQKYWSLSHGFQFGRKLGDWGKDDQNEDVAAVAEAAEAEDEELQEAIRQSLISGGKPSHGAAVATRAKRLLAAGEQQEASGRGSVVADRLRHIIDMAGGCSHRHVELPSAPASLRDASSLKKSQTMLKEGPRAELCPAIPPDSDATPAGVPQPTLRGRPIAPTNNTESSSGPPPDSAQAHQPHDHPSEAQADQVRSIQPVQLPAGHEQPTIKDDAGPSLDDFDFGGLAGMNVFKKRGGAASAAGLSGDAEAAGGRITTQSQPSGSRQMGRTDVAVSAAGSTLNLSRPVAMQQRIGTKMAAPAAAKGSQDAVMQDLSTEDQQPDGISAAAVADDSKQQDSDPPAGVATKVEQPDSNDGDPDPGAAKMAATADQADCINARVLSSSGMDSGGAAGLDAAADSQQRTAGSNHQLLETAAKPSPAEVGNDAKANPEGVFAEEAGMEPQQREGARGTAQGPSGVSGSSALNQNAQVMGDLQQEKEEEMDPNEGAVVAAGLEAAGPSLDMDEELRILEDEAKALQAEQNRQTRNADAPTNEMYGECMELLQMFGLPYIIAPMEAEAQCAWLDSNGLVDGVVTDDNDVFLFGGQHVYRNIFESRKYVEEYRTADVERELGMDRQQLIQLGLLLGSDYSEGVAGVGIVNAIEIVHAFQPVGGLAAFRNWVLTPDAELVAAVQAVHGSSTAAPSEAAEKTGDSEELARFKRNHRGVRRNWDVAPTFPSRAVEEAYMKARVDDAKDSFFFGRPDLQLLQRFCSDRFGWGQAEVDKLLLPVLKAYDERQNQMTMDGYLSFSQRFAKFKSKRLQKAVTGITGVSDPELNLGGLPEPVKKAATRGRKRKSAPAPIPEESALQIGGSESEVPDGDVAPSGAPEGSMQSMRDSMVPAASERGRGKSRTSGTAAPRAAKGQRGRGRASKPPARARGRGRRAGAHSTPASKRAGDTEDEAESGDSEDGLSAVPDTASGGQQRASRHAAKSKSHTQGPSNEAEGVLAELGSEDDGDVDWEDA
ncbi:hypothetical protein WJX84_011927 [Apatococcus fuscideae]|uniref:DNA repair protein UVH3 n=1 Tax=Apatococcus fuscideae TaxID=2026836 RepID=A0AAW1SY38_9CHLO